MMQIKNPIRVAAIVVTATVALVLAYYQESAYAITAKRLDHHRLDEFPFSKTFRTRFPLFNATIWSYHYLQVAVYDPLQAAQDLQAKTQAMRSFSSPIAAILNGRPFSGPSCRLQQSLVPCSPRAMPWTVGLSCLNRPAATTAVPGANSMGCCSLSMSRHSRFHTIDGSGPRSPSMLAELPSRCRNRRPFCGSMRHLSPACRSGRTRRGVNRQAFVRSSARLPPCR